MTIKTGDILWCTYHNVLMQITDDNEGHPAGELRPVRAKSLTGEEFKQSIPSAYFRKPTDQELLDYYTQRGIFKVIRVGLEDIYRDGGTREYVDARGTHYFVWTPSGAVYADSKHVTYLPGVILHDIANKQVFHFVNGQHSPYHANHVILSDTGFEPGSPNDEAARLAAHG